SGGRERSEASFPSPPCFSPHDGGPGGYCARHGGAIGMTLANAADSGTTYTGCLKAGVIFNVDIGSEPRASCSKVAATKVSWNQSGPQGLPGVDGKSAYQVWLDQGTPGRRRTS